MNIDDTLRHMAAQDAIPLPQSYEERLQKVCAALPEAPAGTQRKFPLSRLLLAAALAVGCLALIAMATERALPLLSGGRLVIQADGSWSSTNIGAEFRDPICLEDGKLWFVADGQRLDLTGLIDRDTPYLYTASEEGSSLTHYVAVGGTPERFGWAEWLREGDGELIPTLSVGAWKDYWLYEGQLYDPEDLSPELRDAWDAEGEVHTAQLVYENWYLAALDQLGLERPADALNDQWNGRPIF